MRLAGENGERIVHEEILTNPLMLYQVADLEALEEKQQELLAEDKKNSQSLTRISSKKRLPSTRGTSKPASFSRTQRKPTRKRKHSRSRWRRKLSEPRRTWRRKG
jgi:hypothetical protein